MGLDVGLVIKVKRIKDYFKFMKLFNDYLITSEAIIISN